MPRLIACALAALVLMLVPAAHAAAQGDRTEVDVLVFYTAIPHVGQITCPGGGDPLPTPMPPWCADARTRVRDRILTGVIANTTDARVSGTTTISMNMNLDASFEGPIWGTYLVTVPGRGLWEGTWQGKYRGMGLATYRLVLHGTGEFEGLELRATVVWRAGQGESWTAEIIDGGSE